MYCSFHDVKITGPLTPLWQGGQLSQVLPYLNSFHFFNMPSLTSYAKALQELYTVNLRRPAKFGLQNSLRLYEALHRPLDALPVIHVAGTNGKGSVSLKVSNVLRAAGIRTGLFISPHISSYRERIQVNGEYISEEEMCSELGHILDICESNAIPATFFELTTALAFQHYRKSQCEAVVLEVGLGGRSDSTNVIQPLVSVITSIGMDHCKILGDTIEQIAREKAGIMKRGVPVLIGPGSPIQVMREEANRSEARLVPVHDYLSSEERLFDDRSGRSSDIDNLNSDIAYAVVKLLCDEKFLPGNILGSRIKAALNRVEVWKAIDIRPPCRFELHRITHEHGTTEVVFDIAHNVDAIEALVKKLKSRYQHNKFRVVLGMSADKDVRECLKALLTLTPPAMIHCTEVLYNTNIVFLIYTIISVLYRLITQERPRRRSCGN